MGGVFSLAKGEQFSKSHSYSTPLPIQFLIMQHFYGHYHIPCASLDVYRFEKKCNLYNTVLLLQTQLKTCSTSSQKLWSCSHTICLFKSVLVLKVEARKLFPNTLTYASFQNTFSTSRITPYCAKFSCSHIMCLFRCLPV